MKSKLSIQTILAICACMAFLAGCKTMDNLSKSVSDFLKTDCDMSLEKAEARYAARDYDNALKDLAAAEGQCVDRYGATARVYAQRGIPLHDKLQTYYFNMANRYTNMKQYEAAIKTVDKLSPLTRNQETVKSRKVQIYLAQATEDKQRRKYTSALEAVEKALELSSENEEAIKLKSDVSYKLARTKMPNTMAKIDRLFKTYHRKNLPVSNPQYDYNEGESGKMVTCQFQMGMFTYGQIFGCSSRKFAAYTSAYYDEMLTVMGGYPAKYVNGTLVFVLIKMDPGLTASQRTLVSEFKRQR